MTLQARYKRPRPPPRQATQHSWIPTTSSRRNAQTTLPLLATARGSLGVRAMLGITPKQQCRHASATTRAERESELAGALFRHGSYE
jgi:hypothetical protein